MEAKHVTNDLNLRALLTLSLDFFRISSVFPHKFLTMTTTRSTSSLDICCSDLPRCKTHKHQDVEPAMFRELSGAVASRNYSTMTTLLEKNRCMARHRTDGTLRETLLHASVERQDREGVRILLSYGARWDAPDSLNATPMHRAAYIGLPVILEQLIQAAQTEKRSVDVLDCSRQTPLHVTSERCHDDCAVLLLRAGARINAADHQGFTPLHLAAQKHSVAMVTLLLQHGADVLQEANKSPVQVNKIGHDVGGKNGRRREMRRGIEGGGGFDSPPLFLLLQDSPRPLPPSKWWGGGRVQKESDG